MTYSSVWLVNGHSKMMGSGRTYFEWYIFRFGISLDLSGQYLWWNLLALTPWIWNSSINNPASSSIQETGRPNTANLERDLSTVSSQFGLIEARIDEAPGQLPRNFLTYLWCLHCLFIKSPGLLSNKEDFMGPWEHWRARTGPQCNFLRVFYQI